MSQKLPSDRLNEPRRPWRIAALAAAGLLVIGGAGWGTVALAQNLNQPESQGINLIGDAPEPTPTETPENIAPAAIISPSVVTDLTINVDGSASSDEDGKVTGYTWDFGDGTTGEGVTSSHVYSAGGTYSLTLTVVDDAQATGTATVSVTVTAPPPPPQIVKCPAGTKANAVDAAGNESNCQPLNGQGQQCVAYDDQNNCTQWYKP
jgi:PKD repeat protein